MVGLLMADSYFDTFENSSQAEQLKKVHTKFLAAKEDLLEHEGLEMKIRDHLAAFGDADTTSIELVFMDPSRGQHKHIGIFDCQS